MFCHGSSAGRGANRSATATVSVVGSRWFSAHPRRQLSPISAIYFRRLLRFVSRTPAPPPFSEINSIPPFTSAATSFSAVSGRPPIGPSALSKRAIVGSETPDSLAKSLCDQAKRARAAFSCRIEIILSRLIEFLLIVGRDRGNRKSISEAF